MVRGRGCEEYMYLPLNFAETLKLLLKNKIYWDFTSGPVVGNPPANAGTMDWIPGLGTKIAHVSRQMSPRVPQLLKPVHPRALLSQREKPPQ